MIWRHKMSEIHEHPETNQNHDIFWDTWSADPSHNNSALILAGNKGRIFMESYTKSLPSSFDKQSVVLQYNFETQNDMAIHTAEDYAKMDHNNILEKAFETLQYLSELPISENGNQARTVNRRKTTEAQVASFSLEKE